MKVPLLERSGCQAVKQFRDRSRSSEAHFLDDFVLTHFFADLEDVFLSSDDVNDARWNSSTVGEL